MKSRAMNIQAIFSDNEEIPNRMIIQNGGGKFFFMDCILSKDTSIQEFLREALPEVKPNEIKIGDMTLTNIHSQSFND